MSENTLNPLEAAVDVSDNVKGLAMALQETIEIHFFSEKKYSTILDRQFWDLFFLSADTIWLFN